MVFSGRPSGACHACREKRLKVRLAVCQVHVSPYLYNFELTKSTSVIKLVLAARNALGNESYAPATGLRPNCASGTRLTVWRANHFRLGK